MTGHNDRVVDAPLYARVERQVSRLTREIVAHLVQEIPVYGQLPREQLDGEVASIIEDNLRIFFRGLRESRPPADNELAALRASAVRRAEERVPLDAVLTAYHVGARFGWRALVDDAQPADADALLSAADGVLRYIQAVTAAVSSAYLEEQQAISGEERDARRSLAGALLAGEPTELLATRLGVRVAPAYVALALDIGSHPDEEDVGVVGAVAARRKLRRVQERLDAIGSDPVLGLLDATGGTVLLPTMPSHVTSLLNHLPGLVTDVAKAAGATVIAGAAGCTSTEDLARAARQAHDVLALARRLDRPPGVYQLSDVLLEYQLTRDSDARPVLAGLLDPLEANPDLIRTLEAYVTHELDRRATAGALHVHPNTLDYRLRRVARLTGLDPARPTGLQLLAASLTARRLGAAETG
ncbi:MAG: hypothetical protein QOG53_1567 [Frankiales bacterium]|nr:hypothetical protein [Frankiales bacterium]